MKRDSQIQNKQKVADQVRTDNRFTQYDSIILCDSFLFDIGSRCCSIFIINLVVNTLKDKVCICKFWTVSHRIQSVSDEIVTKSHQIVSGTEEFVKE